jgi:hypothetical protein
MSGFQADRKSTSCLGRSPARRTNAILAMAPLPRDMHPMGRHAYNRLRCAPADGQARDRPGHVARQHRHRDEDDQHMSKVEFRHGFPIVLNRMICGSHTARPRGGEARGVTVTAAPQRQCTRRALRSDYPSLPAQDSWRRRQSMLGESCFEEKASWCTGLD